MQTNQVKLKCICIKNLDVPRSASFTMWKCFSSFNMDYELGARGLRWVGWGGARARGAAVAASLVAP